MEYYFFAVEGLRNQRTSALGDIGSATLMISFVNINVFVSFFFAEYIVYNTNQVRINLKYAVF